MPKIDSVIKEAFKQLESCGGYVWMRLASNSMNLIEIEAPKGGMSVCYLKDIVKSAKLFVRPVQADIEPDEFQTEVGHYI